MQQSVVYKIYEADFFCLFKSKDTLLELLENIKRGYLYIVLELD